jgi:hypothetical protein
MNYKMPLDADTLKPWGHWYRRVMAYRFQLLLLSRLISFQ